MSAKARLKFRLPCPILALFCAALSALNASAEPSGSLELYNSSEDENILYAERKWWNQNIAAVPVSAENAEHCLEILYEAEEHERLKNEYQKQFRAQKRSRDRPDFSLYRKSGEESQAAFKLIGKFYQCATPYLSDRFETTGNQDSDTFETGGGPGETGDWIESSGSAPDRPGVIPSPPPIIPPPGPLVPQNPDKQPIAPWETPQPAPFQLKAEDLQFDKPLCSVAAIADLMQMYAFEHCPISIFQTRSSDPNGPTHILMLGGIELEQSHGVQPAAALQELTGWNNVYREAIYDALSLAHLPRGSRVAIVGFSFGGLVGQGITSANFPGDSRPLGEFGVTFPYVITLGSPLGAFDSVNTKYLHVEATNDPVPAGTRCLIPSSMRPEQLGQNHRFINIAGGWGPKDLAWDNHFRYFSSAELSHCSLQSYGIPCLEVDLNSRLSYPVPRFRTRNGRITSFRNLPPLHQVDSPPIPSYEQTGPYVSNQTKQQITEEIGIAGMEAEAGRDGYKTVLSPWKRDRTTMRQGLDAVYMDGDKIVIAEAKGIDITNGSSDPDSLLKSAYGYRQGTILWAQASAQKMATAYPSPPKRGQSDPLSGAALEAERSETAAAEQVLDALRSCGSVKVKVELFVTEHRRGKPIRTTHYLTDVYPPDQFTR